MPYFVYPADSRPAAFPDAQSLQPGVRIEFPTETEAVDHACQMLSSGKFVAAIQRPDGSLIVPHQIAQRCNPLAGSGKV